MEFIRQSYHWSLRFALCSLLVTTVMTFASCGGAQTGNCNQNDVTRTGPSNQGGCFVSDQPADAIVAAGVAAAGWAVVGCTVNGCVPPYRCNPQSKMCESIHCDENSPCPPAYECDLVSHECQ